MTFAAESRHCVGIGDSGIWDLICHVRYRFMKVGVSEASGLQDSSGPIFNLTVVLNWFEELKQKTSAKPAP